MNERSDQTGNGSGQGGRTVVEEFKVRSEDVIAEIKKLVREGNVRRITIKNEEGKTLIEVPLTVGVIGTLLLPVWAAVGAVAALVANLTLAVERREPAGPTDGTSRPTRANEHDPSPGGEDHMRGDDPLS